MKSNEPDGFSGTATVCCNMHWRRQVGPRGPRPPNGRARIFFVKIEGLVEPVVLNLRFRVRSNAMFTPERRYYDRYTQNIKNNLKLSALFLQN